MTEKITSIQSMEQQRAYYAMTQVQERLQQYDKANNKQAKSEWKARANELPAMIQMNGLGQTAAFYLSKGGVHKDMYDLLSNWLCSEVQIFSYQNLIEGITKSDMRTYQAAQAEAQALLRWVKKFSKAYVSDNE